MKLEWGYDPWGVWTLYRVGFFDSCATVIESWGGPFYQVITKDHDVRIKGLESAKRFAELCAKGQDPMEHGPWDLWEEEEEEEDVEARTQNGG